MVEGQRVSIFNYEGTIVKGKHGYYISFGLGLPHLVTNTCIAQKFNKDFERVSDIISKKLYKNIHPSLVYTLCLFPEFTYLEDLEQFVYFLQGVKKEKLISIF